MNRYIIHIAYLCLTFFLLASCNKQEDVAPQDEGMVTLSISAAMISRSGDSDETGDENRTYDELMHTLRIIIFDEKGDKEDDRLIDFIKEEKRGLFETPKPEYFIVKANETKTIYLLANCEDILKDKEISITNLDAIELKTEDEWFSGQPQNENFLLPATAKYTISVGKESKDLGTLYLAHAANKISFEFTNETGEEINITSWELGSTANKSYLIPHITDDDKEELKWYEKILQYSTNDTPVMNYNIPDDAKHDYLTEELNITINNSEKTTLYNDTPYYFHESKYLNQGDLENPNEQVYNITFEVNGKAYTKILPELPSLFRGTYVKVIVTFYKLIEEDGKEGIYAEISPWINGSETSGVIEPLDENN